jgi:hypothetical protein
MSWRRYYHPTHTLPDEDGKEESTTMKAQRDKEEKQISRETEGEREMFSPPSCVGCVIPS